MEIVCTYRVSQKFVFDVFHAAAIGRPAMYKIHSLVKWIKFSS